VRHKPAPANAGFFGQLGSPGGASAADVPTYDTGCVASYITGRFRRVDLDQPRRQQLLE
jgi:hypothetical protein